MMTYSVFQESCLRNAMCNDKLSNQISFFFVYLLPPPYHMTLAKLDLPSHLKNAVSIMTRTVEPPKKGRIGTRFLSF